MLLRRNDLIINTDQIIKAEYHSKGKSTLRIYMADGGGRPKASDSCFDNVVWLTETDADLMWSMLCQLATAVVHAPRP